MSASASRPLFSIVVPCFNARGGVERTLQSLRTQDNASLEIVVVDGCSTDETQEYLSGVQASWGGRLRWQSEPDAGVYDAMNKGLARARGRYVLFLGAGDLLLPDVLPQVAARIAAETAPSAAASTGDDLLLHGDIRRDDGSRYGGPFSRWRLRVQNLPHQALFYGRDLLARVGSYSLEYPIYADYEFNMRCWADRRATAIYVPLLVCDFETAGLSSRRDTAFQAARLGLIRRYLGWDVFLLSWLGSKAPRNLRHLLWLPLHKMGLLRHATPGEKRPDAS